MNGVLPYARGVHIAAISLMITAVTLGLATVALHVIAMVRGQTIQPGDYWLFNAVVAVAFSASGAAIAWRRPSSPIGWAFVAGALGNGLAGTGSQYSVLTGDPIGYWLLTWAWIPLPLAIAVTLHTFPTGRALSARWRPALLAVFPFGGAAMLVAATSPSEGLPSYLGPPVVVPWPAWVAVVSPFLLLAPVLTGLASLILRFRRSRGDEREQLKWLVVASVPLTITFVVIGNVIGSAAAVLLFAAPVTLAILRYRLYDIDLLINRTLVYGALSALLAAAYVLGIVLFQTLLRPLTSGSEIAVTASTLAVIALFGPLRRRIQQGVDRRFYRRRYDAGATVDAFALRLRDSVDLDALTSELLSVVGDTVQPAHASVWLRERRG